MKTKLNLALIAAHLVAATFSTVPAQAHPLAPTVVFANWTYGLTTNALSRAQSNEKMVAQQFSEDAAHFYQMPRL